jgi:hypothetical protein
LHPRPTRAQSRSLRRLGVKHFNFWTMHTLRLHCCCTRDTVISPQNFPSLKCRGKQ